MTAEMSGFSWRRFIPMGTVQFTSVFIDYAFKSLAALAAFVYIGENYANRAAFVSLLALVYTAPFVFNGGLAGFFADRLPKNLLLIFVKVAELILLVFAFLSLYYLDSWGTFPLILAILLLALQSVFLSPAYNGLIPEIFGETGASQANGVTGMVTSLAVILGGVAGFVFPAFAYLGNYILTVPEEMKYTASVVPLFALSLLGLCAAFFIVKMPAADPERKLGGNWLWRQFADAWALRKDFPLFLSVCGDAFFCALSVVVLTVLLVFLTHDLGISEGDSLSIGAMNLMLGAGVGLGSFVAGRISGRRIELGLVPFGVIGMGISLLLIPFAPGPALHPAGLTIYPLLAFWLFGLGFWGGFFIVPLRAFMQCRVDRERVGSVLAAANIICFGAILLASAVVFWLTAGIGSDAAGLWSGSAVEWIQRHSLTLTPWPVFVILTICTIITLYIAITRSTMGMRAVTLIISEVLYRVQIRGKGRIPKKGPVLIIANHVTLVDSLMLSRLTTRRIRFLMHEDFYNQSWVKPLAKLGNFIIVPSHQEGEGYDKLYEVVHELLRNNEILCVFPETKLVRTGVMAAIRAGYYGNMLKDFGHVPVVPVNLAFPWGSLFSRTYGDGLVTLQMPHKLPYRCNITVGKPLRSDETTPFALQRIIGELGAETEAKPWRKARPLHYQFAKVASRHPFRVIITESSGKQIKNYEFWTASALLSRELRKTTDNQYVAIMLPNCIACAIGVMGTLMADKTPAVLNFTASREALRLALEKTHHPIIITSRLFLDKINFEPMENMWFLEDMVKRIPKWKKIAFAAATFCIPYPSLMKWISPKSHRDVKRPGVILFSSGSSGIPKAVVLSHHNLNSDVNAMLHVMGWRKTDKMSGSLPLFHSYGFTTGFWLPFMTLSPVGYTHSPLDGAAVGELVEKQGLTALLATPTFLQNYMRRIRPEQLKTVRIVIVGGEKMRQELADKFKERFGIEPIEGYGATELSPVSAINISMIEGPEHDFAARPGKRGSIGRALPNFVVKTVDIDTGEPLEHDQEGLLMFKSPCVMTGYLDDPEATEKVVIDGWYNTGDLATVDLDGYIFVTGRLSRFSKIGGEMVPHERIETLLIELNGEEERAIAVTGVPDADRGEKLVILRTDTYPLSPEEIIKALKDAGMPNLWIPKIRDIYTVEKVPLLGSGKLDLPKTNALAKEVSEKAVSA